MAKKLKRVELEAKAQSRIWTVWASAEDSVTIGLMTGVVKIMPAPPMVTERYDLYVDPRYDLEGLKAEILALNKQASDQDDDRSIPF